MFTCFSICIIDCTCHGEANLRKSRLARTCIEVAESRVQRRETNYQIIDGFQLTDGFQQFVDISVSRKNLAVLPFSGLIDRISFFKANIFSAFECFVNFDREFVVTQSVGERVGCSFERKLHFRVTFVKVKFYPIRKRFCEVFFSTKIE
jgi:hypothetical protein